MKEYAVYFDITVSSTVYVEAESEEEAKKIASKKVANDPYYYAYNCDAYVDHGVVDVDEV